MDEGGEIPTLIIRFNPGSNQVSVQGPIKDRMLAYGMLKLAEKAIDEDHATDKAHAIIPANGERFLKRYR